MNYGFLNLIGYQLNLHLFFFSDDFKDYSEICFKTFGDRVNNWITINEPFIIAVFGYELGLAAPGRCSLPGPPGPCPAGNSSTEPYIVSHNLLLAHATAVRLYKKKFQVRQIPPLSMT
jgi:beta-glucosidase